MAEVISILIIGGICFAALMIPGLLITLFIQNKLQRPNTAENVADALKFGFAFTVLISLLIGCISVLTEAL